MTRSLLAGIGVTGALLVAVVFRIHGGDPSGPFWIGDRFTTSREAWPLEVAIVEGAGFDGQFYLALALDPLLRGPLVATLDDVRYRGRRIVVSAAAWLVGAGRPRAVVWALLVLNGLAVAAAGALVGGWAGERGASWLWSIVAVSAIGNVVSLERGLVDGVQGALLVATCVAAARGTPRAIGLGVIAFALAVLQKETALAAFPLVLVPLVRARDPRLWGAAALAGAGVLGWWGYVEARAAAPAVHLFAINFDLPGRGWTLAMLDALSAQKSWLRKAKDVAFLSLHLAAIGVGLRVGTRAAIEALRRRRLDPLALSIGLLAALCACLSFALWREVWGYARTALPLVALLLLHDLDRRREGAGRAGVGAGGLVAGGAALAGIAFAAASLVLRVG